MKDRGIFPFSALVLFFFFNIKIYKNDKITFKKFIDFIDLRRKRAITFITMLTWSSLTDRSSYQYGFIGLCTLAGSLLRLVSFWKLADCSSWPLIKTDLLLYVSSRALIVDKHARISQVHGKVLGKSYQEQDPCRSKKNPLLPIWLLFDWNFLLMH